MDIFPIIKYKMYVKARKIENELSDSESSGVSSAIVVQETLVIAKKYIPSIELIPKVDHHDCVFNTLEEVLTYRINVILEKCDEFFKGYNNISNC